MKAMILCGGQGTRLREHTETRPKPMVEIGQRPILWHIMKMYAHYGISDFILCLGYKGDQVKDYFLNYEARSSDFTVELGRRKSIELHGPTHGEDSWRVTLADTGEAAMTGARVLRGARYLGDSDRTFAVTYGDGVADLNLREALDFHRKQGAVATVTGVHPPGRFGALEERDNRVVAFREKPLGTDGLINGGFFFFQREFLDYLENDDGCILERAPLERCAADGNLFVFRHDGYWQCMDTYRDWEQLERHCVERAAPWQVWK